MKVRARLIGLSLAVFASGCSSNDSSAPIASLNANAVKLVSNGSALVWIDDVGKAVVTAKPLANASQLTLASGSVIPSFLAADTANAYFIADADLFAVPLLGGAKRRVSDGDTPIAATIRGDSAYFMTFDRTVRKVMIKSKPLSGAQPATTLGELTYGGPAILSPLLAATRDTLYVSTVSLGIATLALAHPSTPTLSMASPCDALVADDSDAFCLAHASSQIFRLGPDGAGSLFAEMGSTVVSIALDATHLYVGGNHNAANAEVARIARSGGAKTTVANEGVSALAVDTTAVYWATGTGQIRWQSK